MNFRKITLACVILCSISGQLWAQKPTFPEGPGIDAPEGTIDDSYAVSVIPLNLRDISASGTNVPLGDDSTSGLVSMGFAFIFFGNTYTQADISSNGFVGFDVGMSQGCCTGQPIPTNDFVNNMVAGYWEDLDPPEGVGNVRYQTLGVAPNREFVVGFYDVQHFPSGNPVTMEMILHEGTNNVELQYLSAPSDGGTHSIGVESAGGLFGTQVDFGSVSYANEGRLLEPTGGAGSALARFAVSKDFDDNNPAEVQVTLSCNTGLPLEQTTDIAEGDGATIIVGDFTDGELDCTLTETGGLVGYDVSYFDGLSDSPDGCVFEFVNFDEERVCQISNALQEVEVVVTKEWIDDNPQFNAQNIAEATFSCVNEQFGQVFGTLRFVGNGDTDSFGVFPHWDGTTVCDVTESFLEGGVEADSSDCQGLSVTPGSGASCTIVNTRLFEGIPTLSQYGLMLLAMLMLGIGFVAFRRIA